jgi:hypothetical protein
MRWLVLIVALAGCQAGPVRTVVVSDSLLNETIVAQRDTIEALRDCLRRRADGVRYPVCNP